MKMATKILSGICTLILCFVLLPTNISCQGYPASSEEAITINYDFPEPRVEETWEIPPPKGALPVTEGYVSVTMEGLPQWSEPGLPVLPFKTASVLLPYGFDIERITVTCGNKVALPGSYMVEPGQEAVPLSYEGSVNVTPPDPGVYDSSAPFPGKLYSGAMVQNKSGYRILLVNLHPVEYISERGQLSYYETMTIQVTLRASGEGEWQGVSHLAQDEDVVREMVDNPETIRSYHAALPSFETLSLLAPGDYEYVIITSEALNATPGPDNFQALRDEKISRGITATIVTTEWIYANYPGTRPDEGADNQTRIRNFIIDAYNTWGTKYVLLGGDGDGADVGGESGDDIIPHRGFASLGDSDIPADMYYACLDGTFDDDADGVYGEPNDGPGGGEVDLFAEVYVGRAPVDSEAEVQNFVGKTLAYQSMAMTDENLRKVWMVGEKLDSATWGGDYKDEIKDGSSAHGNTTVGFEDSNYTASFDVSTLYDRDYPGHNWPKSEIVGIINDNAHLVNHLGHANVGYAMKMYNTDVDGLTNEELYFIGYSQGCYNGAFDNRTETPGVYTDYDCISEHLTTEPHGAVAFIANSRYGWYSPGSTDGPSQHYDRAFWDAVLGKDILNIGIANQDSKEDNAGRVGNSYDRWCYYEINLFGDPELTLKLYEGVIYESHEIDDSAGGDGDGYPEPGESINMTVTLRNISTNTTFFDVTATLAAISVDVRIFSEDFEGSWPGDWEVGDWNSSGGEDYWGQSDYRAYSGNFSAYCAEVSDVPGQYYDNYMQAFMVRDVDLSAYASANLSYKYWLDCEYSYDHLDAGYFDGSWHWVQSHTGNSSGWLSDSIEVPPTATQGGFRFYSDSSVTKEGAYIDDVVLTGCSYVTDPYVSISDNSEEYGDIPPSDVATSLGAYDFTLGPACSVVAVVTFNLTITASNGGPWTGFDVRVIVASENTPPEVSSVSATQRSDGSGIVDISYKVSYNETVYVALEYWDPSGSWHSCTNTAGDVGPGINTGTGKAATWDAKAQLGGVYISGCKVRVTATDGAGGIGSAVSNTFNLATAPPTITGKSPTGSAVSVDSSIIIAFSESMNASSAENAFSISPTILGSFSWTDDTMTFDPTTNLAYSTEYAITIHGTAMDSAGNGLDGNENGIDEGSPADDYTWSFTTKAAVAGGGCFIATAAYGTPMAEEIQILREFRDEYLLTNPVGQTLVGLYYRVSPPIAQFITEHPSLKPIVRAGLVPAVAMSTIAVNTSPVEKIAIVGLLVLISVALAVWATRRRGRGPQYT